MLIGQVVQEEGPCKGFRVIWPGSRVQLDQLPKEGEKDLITNNIEWKHLYWMRDDKVGPSDRQTAGQREALAALARPEG